MPVARTVTLSALGVMLAGAGYLVADAYDLVPGWITVSEPGVLPAPFVTASPVAVASGAPAASAVTSSAPIPSADVVQALAVELTEDPRLGPSVAVSVVDALTGEVLADVAADNPQVPASSTKLLTAIAALHDLGPDFRTETTVLWDESTATLTLVAGGDALLAAGTGGGEGTSAAGADAVGYAGLADLAQQVVGFIGPEFDDVNLVVDDTLFDNSGGVNPSWPAYAWANGYVAKVTGLAVDAARLDPDQYYSARATDPSLAAASDLSAALQELGLVVSTPERGTASASSVLAGAVESAPLEAVVEYFLIGSENTVSETVSLVHAVEMGYPGTPAGAAEATAAALADMGVSTEGLELFDGAGFAETNQIPPALFTSALVASMTDPNLTRLPDLLPVSSLEGTMRTRLVDTAGSGVVRAKTGSLTGVTALAGYLTTADGRLLAFSVLIDGMTYDPQNPRDAVDDFLAPLAECGCS